MERESFIFYRIFYEAIRNLQSIIKLEVFTAITEYALYGKLPVDLKPFANGMFTLIKPNIDVNTARFENGKKGGRKTKQQPTPAEDDYSLSYEQEVELLRNDKLWCSTICQELNITAKEFDLRLSRFLDRCNEDKKLKGKLHHNSYTDCISHLRYWMAKVYPPPQPRASDNNFKNNPPTSTTDYTYNGGFGGKDV